MAASLKTVDTDIITLRQVYVRSPVNGYIPAEHVLISDGGGNGYWNSVSSIYTIPYDTLRDSYGSTMIARNVGNVIKYSTVGIHGLFDAYVDMKSSTFTFSNAAPPIQVALNTVPTVSRLAAQQMPGGETITMSSSQSTLKFLGVGDVQLSTVTDLRAVFISISSFTASGYADISNVGRAWIASGYSTTSTNAGYASFVSSIPFSTFYNIDDNNGYGWDWSPALGSNIPMSTVETYPNYSTGDVYFSTVSFTMAPYLRYIRPNSTTKMFLEFNPSYFFQRMYLGTSTPYHLVKEFSTFVQYQSRLSGRQILSKASFGGYLTSQNSNAYTSNYYNTQMKLELDTAILASNALRDGPYGAYYTIYHRIPGGMANLLPDGYCSYTLGARSGFSNAQIVNVDNYSAPMNSVYLHVYNQPGSAPPMTGP